MERRMTWIAMLPLVLAAALAGCASDAQVTAADPTSVSVSYKPTKVEDANEAAQKYCGSYARRAQFRSTHQESDGRLLGIYDCVPATASVPQ